MMSWKAALALLFVMMMVLGTYLKYFDHPSGAETLLANRNLGNLEDMSSFFKKAGYTRDEAVYRGQEYSTDSSDNMIYNSSERILGNREQLKDVNQEEDKSDASLNKSVSTNSSVGRTDDEASLPHHGIEEFDWNGWVEQKDFVSIGSFWGYCDEEDPVMIGKILLFSKSGYQSVTALLNTTFDADIHNGTAEGRFLRYDTELVHRTYNLCDLAEKYEDDFFLCPIAAGEKFFMKEKPVSRFLFSGEYTAEITMRDGNGRAVICGRGTLKI